MTKLVFYFHGYGSEPKGPKIDMLREAGFDVFAFKIDVNPNVSLPALCDAIEMVLAEYANHDVRYDHIVFVGTSLGAWYAEHLSRLFKVKAFLINPSYEPAKTLDRYGVSKEIRDTYAKLGKFEIHTKNMHYISINDEIIDHSKVWVWPGENFDFVKYFEDTDHRFSGPEFKTVVNDILSL